MKLLTKDWYQTMQDSGLGVQLRVDDRAAECSEELFRKIREEELSDWLEMRRELWRREPDTVKRQGLWRQAMTPEIFNYIRDERLEQAKNEIRRKIGCAGAESSDSSCGDS